MAMRYPHSIVVKLLIVLPFLACSCNPAKIAVRQTAIMIENGVPAFEEDDDIPLLESAFPANIKLLEALLVSSPEDDRLLALISRMYAGFTFAIEETRLEAVRINEKKKHPDCFDCLGPDELKQTVSQHYLKGAEYGLMALEVNYPDCRLQLKNVNTVDQFLQSVSEDDIHALFWYGFNLGAWVNLNIDSIRAMSRAHIAQRIMDRVVEMDPGYSHGFAHLFLLSYHAIKPPMLGGRPDLALSHYHSLKNIAGNDFLLADLFYARYYLHQMKDKEKFEKVLNKIIQNTRRVKKYALYNQVAENRAAIYLSQMDQLFE